MRFRKCCVCGREFPLQSESVYKLIVKRRVKHICSWGCKRVLERKLEEEKAKEEKERENR